MQTFLLMMLVVAIGSLLSLLFGSLLFIGKTHRAKIILMALPFGAGALLAAAFFGLLPESFEMREARLLILWTLGGFVSFFLLERLAGWFHHHHEHENNSSSRNMLLMVGDFTHNVIDGIAIGAAFVASLPAGLVATIAVNAHEIPKELGTFGILMSRGWSGKKVVAMNAVTAIGTLIAAAATYLLGAKLSLPLAELLAVTAGMFIYIAASDIIPEIHERPKREGNIQAGMLLLGIAIIGAIIIFAPHSHHEDLYESARNSVQAHPHDEHSD